MENMMKSKEEEKEMMSTPMDDTIMLENPEKNIEEEEYSSPISPTSEEMTTPIIESMESKPELMENTDSVESIQPEEITPIQPMMESIQTIPSNKKRSTYTRNKKCPSGCWKRRRCTNKKSNNKKGGKRSKKNKRRKTNKTNKRRKKNRKN